MRSTLIVGVAVRVGWTLLAGSPAQAAIVRLHNGDQLTGRIVAEQPHQVQLEHEVLGLLSIKKAQVVELVRDEPVAASPYATVPEPEWVRQIALGYNVSSGNTEDEGFTGKLAMNRKTGHNEWTAQTEGAYASSAGTMITQRYDGSLRYAFSFGPDLAWYNFYKVQGSHDRFANVDGRLVASSGIGYWFADREDWKAMAEVGLGWERTNFRRVTPSRSDPVLVPRAYAQTALWGDSTLSQNVVVWPSLGDLSEYRLRAETVLDHPVTGGMSLQLRFVDEYQSEPGDSAKRNDARLTSSLVYAF